MAQPTKNPTSADGWLARSVFYVFLGLIAWAPFPLASNRPWSWSFLSLAVGGLLVFWSVAVILRPELMRLSWRRCLSVGALFAAVACWAFIQTLGITPNALHDPMWSAASDTLGRTIPGTISADPSASIGGLMRLMAYGGVFWLAAQYARHPLYARQTFWCIGLVGIGYALYGLVVFSTGNQTILWFDRWAYPNDLTSTFVSRSAFGAFCGITLLAALALIFQIAGRNPEGARAGQTSWIDRFDALPVKFYFLITGCLVLATALVLSHSRGAVAVSALGIGTMLTMMIFRHKGRRRFIMSGAVLIIVVGATILQLSGQVTLGRTLQLSEQGTGRDAIHSLARRGIDAAPLTGHGLDTFRHLYFRYRDMDIPWDSPRYDKAHNTYLELMLELGPIGFALLMGAITIIIGTLFVGVVRRRRDAIYPIVGLATSVLIGTHAVLDFSVQMPAIAVTYAAILGVGFAQSWRSDRPDTSVSLPVDANGAAIADN